MSDKDRIPAAASTPLTGLSTVDEHEGEPMTSEQADILRALCEAKGVPFDESLSHAGAAYRIAALKGDLGLEPPQM